MSVRIEDRVYRCPQDLAVTPTKLNRIIIVGSCLMAGWPDVVAKETPGCPSDFFLLNNAGELPSEPLHPIREYDFQLIQIPLRTVLPDSSYFRLSYHDRDAYEKLFEDARERMAQFLAAALRWNVEHGILTFVSNFLVPQQNAVGRLMPRYDLRNPVYLVERLNQELSELLSRCVNVFLFDYDQIMATFGRRHFQDDIYLHTGHASALTDGSYELDQQRLERTETPRSYYPTKVYEYMQYAWAELVAMYRTVQRTDEVKLVIVDIDDTLWRGVAAEETTADPALAMEGWPLGVIEALGCLKRRGVLLAIVSKNDEERVIPIWKRLVGNRLLLEDFAVRKIDWRPKADNIEEMLGELGLLPKSVVFIDDNPVERAAVKAAFPAIRTMGPTPYIWRRILLWSSETQVADITAESATRSEMVRAQVERETQRKQLTRQEFLNSLDLRVRLFTIDSLSHAQFARSLELINKTNQFNTTGKRWTLEEAMSFFAAGGQFYSFEAEDRFTHYGNIGVVVVQGTHLVQFVMSCRVLGMEVETAAIAGILRIGANGGAREYSATLRHTEANLPCRNLYQRCGFTSAGDETWRPTSTTILAFPSHILLSVETANGGARTLINPVFPARAEAG